LNAIQKVLHALPDAVLLLNKNEKEKVELNEKNMYKGNNDFFSLSYCNAKVDQLFNVSLCKVKKQQEKIRNQYLLMKNRCLK
jgi:hypothetical protein